MSKDLNIEKPGIHLVFSTDNGALYQCDDSESFIIRFHGEEITLRPCAFLAFRRKIQQIDLAAWLIGNGPDLEIIPMPHCDRIFAFDLRQVLELRELLGGSFAMLSLNSIIHKQLVRNV